MPPIKIVFNNIKDNENTSIIFNWLKDETLDKFLSNNIIKNSDIFIKTENNLDSVCNGKYYLTSKTNIWKVNKRNYIGVYYESK